LPRFTITALLATLVFIFAFQADNITNRFFHVVLIAVPITLIEAMAEIASTFPLTARNRWMSL